MAAWLKKNWKLALGVTLGGLFIASVFASKHFHDKAVAADAMVQALKDQVAEFGKQVAVEREKVKEAEAAVQVHKAQEEAQVQANKALAATVAELRKRLVSPPTSPEGGGPVGDEERDGWKAAVKTRDDLIAGLDQRVAGLESHVAVLKDTVADLETGLAHANTALDLSDKEKAALTRALREKEIAYDAMRHANTFERIKWFGYGFLGGILGGARVRF